MPGFELAPLDGGRGVVLPPGETVLGRGALLGITDKRVSRKHAILKVAGTQLSIKPVHINPCFYQPTANGQLLPLDTDKWHQLNPGDTFSLLVDKHVFKVLFSPSESLQRKTSRRQVEDMTNQIPVTLQQTRMADRQPGVQERKSSSTSQHLEGRSLLGKITEIQKKHSATICDTEKPQLTQRKRTLPAWMLQANTTPQDPSTSVPERGGGEKIKKAPGKKKITENEAAFEAQRVVQGTSIKPDAERRENREREATPQAAGSSAVQRSCLLKSEELSFNLDPQACSSTGAETTNTAGNRLGSISSKSERVSRDEASQSSVHQGEIQELALNQGTERDIASSAGSQDISQSSGIPRPQRIACQYGRSCYRKNPMHFQQFSHPGDSDYDVTETVTQTDTDNRPECPYGTTCYRKNPQHRLEYKHTAPPESERRQTRSKAAKQGRWAFSDNKDHDDDEFDEGSSADSFIDHEENEEECDPTDEDPDWEPDVQDQDHEDFDTLLKEAHTFVNSKK